MCQEATGLMALKRGDTVAIQRHAVNGRIYWMEATVIRIEPSGLT